MIVTDECGAGHESAGEVIEVGEGVVDLKVGDRVAIEAGVPCGQADCEPCREGEYKACKSIQASPDGTGRKRRTRSIRGDSATGRRQKDHAQPSVPRGMDRDGWVQPRKAEYPTIHLILSPLPHFRSLTRPR